ncbi:MAG: XisH family protein [Chitinophagales bacterium]
MPAKDKYHDAVIRALIKDGWEITHDPYIIKTEGTTYQVDLGAEKMIAAEKDTEKIAVEVKSFLNESVVSDFHTALGQYLSYRLSLVDQEAERHLYLAMPLVSFIRIQKLPVLQKIIAHFQVSIFVYNPHTKEIVTWKR